MTETEPGIQLDFSFTSDAPKQLEAALQAHPRVHSIDLSHCQLNEIPKSIGLAIGLKVLKIGMNPLETDALRALSGLTSLETLIVNKTQLKHWPSPLGALNQLETLDLTDNQLKVWPALSAGNCQNLKALRLYGNSINQADSPPRSLPKLEELSLGSSKRNLAALCDGYFSQMRTLKSLRIWGALKSLPSSLKSLVALTDLDLRGNPLNNKSWPLICSLLALEELHLQESQISDIPDSIVALAKLRQLELQKCKIEAVSKQLWTLKNLESLDLSDNRVGTLPEPLSSLPKLRKLWLGRNQLTTLPEDMSPFSAVDEFDLEDNRLSTIPPSSLTMTQLKEFTLTGNPFESRAEPLVASVKKQMYQRDPFALVHEPRFLQAALIKPTYHPDLLDLSVREACIALGARFQKSAGEPEKWQTASGVWPLSEAARSFIRDIHWPEHGYFDLTNESLDIWSVDFSKPRPIADFECSYLRPFICIADYHGGNELLLVSLDDKNPGNPRLYNLDHEDGSRISPNSLEMSLGEFLLSLR
jgi:Leucine-rich repeat (LRR) protein